MELGRICYKVAGRDSLKVCVVTEILNDTFVKIDGETRKRKCNINHLEPTDKLIKISKSSTHTHIIDELKKAGFDVRERKLKQAKKKSRPKRKRKVKTKKEELSKEAKKKTSKKKPVKKK